MNSSEGVSILDLKTSFDSGVGSGDARGSKGIPKSFHLPKIQTKSLKIRKEIPQNLVTDVSAPLFSLRDE